MGRILNAIVAIGLTALVAYGVVAWWPERGHFPSDMRDSTLEAVERGTLRAASLAERGADPMGERALDELARRLDLRVEWHSLPAADALRRLRADSLDVLVHFEESVPLTEGYGFTRPYQMVGRARYVLAVPAGENRLLQEADRAVEAVAGRVES